MEFEEEISLNSSMNMQSYCTFLLKDRLSHKKLGVKILFFQLSDQDENYFPARVPESRCSSSWASGLMLSGTSSVSKKTLSLKKEI